MSLNRKKEILDAYERSLAMELGEKMLERPKMNVWMILIPVIFVFHCQRHKRFVDGKKKFIEEWMRNKRQAMEAALDEAGGQPRDPGKWRKSVSHLPLDVQEAYLRMQHFLTDHYKKILQAKGAEMAALVQQAYNRDAYVSCIQRRMELECGLSKTLLAVHTDPEEKKLLYQLDQECAVLYKQSLRDFYPDSSFESF